jgi:hypothetical protein
MICTDDAKTTKWIEMQITIRLLILLISFSLVKFVAAGEKLFTTNDSGNLLIEPAELTALLRTITAKKEASSFSLGRTRKNQTIGARYFPGRSNKNALIIGGVHGSELSSIAVAKELITLLSEDHDIYYNVIIIPCLFPDNAAAAMARLKTRPEMTNFGRYTTQVSVDPNRQMPSPGQYFTSLNPCDHLNRTIENENQLLLQIIQEFKPARIASIHAIRDTAHAGVYADPRTDANGVALGFDTDSSLAVDMATLIKEGGGNTAGNFSNGVATALYHKDPAAAPAGQFQNRNYNGSSLPGNRGSGTSLGTWATTAIEDNDTTEYNRPAIRLLTVEFPGYWTPDQYKTVEKKVYFKKQVILYSTSLLNIFLQDNYVEE